jgi:MFS family permease
MAGARDREFPDSIENRASWVTAFFSLAILSVSYGSALIVIVGLKPIAASLAADRSAIALAGALAWLGMGLGGILMGWVADRIGVRKTVIFGALMTAAGLALSTTGQLWALYIGHGVLIGVLGNGAIYPPLVIYVSRWFDRRRGTAIALISSGQYVAGVLWPSVFELGLSHIAWRGTMLAFAGLTIVGIVPLALALRPAPQPLPARPVVPRARRRSRVLGMPANQVQALLCFAGFLCCVPMAIPSAHLVAFCSDLGIPAAQGAAMLSVLLGAAFLSRQFWGWLADNIGGLRAVLVASACQTLAIAAFLATQNEIGLFAVSAAFGLGFSGIVPAYVLAIRELFPSREASWRVPTFLLFGMAGMAFGSWFAGALYDHFGFYAPAFAAGAGFNLLNLLVLGFLLLRSAREARLQPASAV